MTSMQPEGAKDWIQNPTRFKLREAKYFLDKARLAYTTYKEDTTDENRDVLLFSLDSFFSAARSITFYMQKQYNSKPCFEDWYSSKQKDMKGDNELKFLNKLRVDFIHIKTPIIATVREATYMLAAYVKYADNHPLKGTEPPLTDIQPVIPFDTQIKTLEVIFDTNEYAANEGLGKDTEVLPFCDRQLHKFEDLIDECEKRFK